MSGHPWDAKRVSETGASCSQELFSCAANRGVRVKWPLTVAFPAKINVWNAKKLFVFGYTVVPTINHRHEIRVEF